MRPDLGAVFIAAALALVFLASQQLGWSSAAPDPIDNQLTRQLRELGFTGRIESTLAARLGRHVDPPLADIGRLLWFDTVIGLKGDNTCAGCHSPTNGFGDSQPIAVGIDNNGIVGPDRAGPRNMRRAPMVLNAAFFPSVMWNSRFSSRSGDPFDNHAGFEFPLPEGMTLSAESHLLIAQAFIPPTERTEAAGFDFPGDNNAMRAEVVRRVDRVTDYRRLFAERFPSVRAGAPIDYDMFARAIAEFEFSLTFADSPIDRYARGDIAALDDTEKGGAILFFGKTRVWSVTRSRAPRTKCSRTSVSMLSACLSWSRATRTTSSMGLAATKTLVARTSPGILSTGISFGLPRSAMSRARRRSCMMARSERSSRQSAHECIGVAARLF